jgi:transposase
MILLRCPSCKSKDVHVQAWVDVNTNEFKDYVTDQPYYYCNNCGCDDDPEEAIVKPKKKKKKL